MIQHLNADPDASGADLWGEPTEPTPPPALDDLIGEFVTLVRPQSKSRMIKVDDMRGLEHNLQLSAPPSKTKIAVIKDAERVNEAGMNAFLKTLEEPPSQSLIFLLTSRPERLLDTILSRCISVPLIAKDSAITFDGLPELEEALRNAMTSPPGYARALAAKAAFTQLLEQKKAEITKRQEAAYKEETLTYKKTSEGDWLKERENYYKALTESEYIGERELLTDWLTAWLGDALRQKEGITDHLACPNSATATARLAATESVHSLLKRIDALNKTRANLETNAHEALVLETGFLNAFE